MTYPWTSGGPGRHPAARLDVSNASVHLDRTRPEMEEFNPRRLDTPFKPRRLPGGGRNLFTRSHKVRRLGATGGYVGSGRESTLQLSPLYVSDIPRPAPTTRAVSGPKNLALGGACTDALTAGVAQLMSTAITFQNVG